MCENDLDLSLNGETFASLKKDFDTILERTIGNMTMKGAEDATITIKLGVSLQKTSVPAKGKIREVTKPTFKHDIASVMQVKDKMSGQLTGNMELVWDDDLKQYVLRPIDDGQTSLFDQEPDYEDVTDEDCEACTINYDNLLPNGQKMIEAPKPADDGDGESEYEYDDPENPEG